MVFNKTDIVKIAKRINNRKRSFLLVNPLQAKHVPAPPSALFKLIENVAGKIDDGANECTVISFAETATSAGSVLAQMRFPDRPYIQTTREKIDATLVEFTEDHSHAVDQSINKEKLGEFLTISTSMVIIDDEYSTGNTLINIVTAIRNEFPFAKNYPVYAVSIINRMSDENIKKCSDYGIIFYYVQSISPNDFVSCVDDMKAECAAEPHQDNIMETSIITISNIVSNPRNGVIAKQYANECLRMSQIALEKISKIFDKSATNILVLGTEESMFPAQTLARCLEDTYANLDVKCHATTRSPIGIAHLDGYPIQNGFKLESLYEKGRTTYLYNLRKYDGVVVVTDAHDNFDKGIETLSKALSYYGNNKMIVVRI